MLKKSTESVLTKTISHKQPAINGTAPLIPIEFRYDGSAGEAIAQIKTQEYFKRCAGLYRHIFIVGINYSTRTRDHQCLIETLS